MNSDYNKYLLIIVLFLMIIVLLKSNEKFSNESNIPPNLKDISNESNPSPIIKRISGEASNNSPNLKDINDNLKNTLLVIKSQQKLLSDKSDLENEKKLAEDNIVLAKSMRDQSIINLEKAIKKLDEIKIKIADNNLKLSKINVSVDKNKKVLNNKINNGLKNAQENILKVQNNFLLRAKKSKIFNNILKIINYLIELLIKIGRKLIGNLPI